MKQPLTGFKNVRCPENDSCTYTNYHGHYCIPGDPVPLARARYGNRRVWDSQRETKVNTGIYLANQHDKAARYNNALQVDLYFYFPIPQSLSVRKQEKLRGTHHRFKPDLSNLIKFIEDVGNDLLYHDDARIAILNAQKLYCLEPRTEFVVMELG